MNERQMEDLLAAFPDDFFHEHSLVLKGRQQVFSGVGRFDLLFTDRYQTNVLMELKAVTAKYENAAQLAKYKEALEAKGEQNILMWLVAPSIPTSVREFLDRIGIEYTEIHEATFRRVAERHGVVTTSGLVPEVTVSRQAKEVRYSRDEGVLIDGYALMPSIDKSKLAQLLQAFEAAARRGIDRSLARNLREEILEPHTPAMSRSTMMQLAKWCKTTGPPYQDGMPVAQKISELLFGLVLDRDRLGT